MTTTTEPVSPAPSPFSDPRVIKAGLALVTPMAGHGTVIDLLSTHDGYRSPVKMLIEETMKPVAERTEIYPSACEIAEFLYLMTRPAAESRAALKGGREAFRETAILTTADALPLGLAADLFVAALSHFIESLTSNTAA